LLYQFKAIDGSETGLPNTKEIQEHFDNRHNYGIEVILSLEGLDEVLKPADTLLDIGANIGIFATYFRPYAKKIICVEPTPTHLVKLRQVVGEFATIDEHALAGHIGEASFYTCGINTTMNSLHQRDYGIPVKTTTLKDLLDRHNLQTVDLCKVDIEGGEDVAITIETINATQGRIKKFFIELHPPTQHSVDKWKNIFQSCGYQTKDLPNAGLLCEL
jgi:FkbM family methyltransferase